MLDRMIRYVAFAAVVGIFTFSLAQAADPQLHEGTVVSAAAGKVVIKDKAGKDQSFAVDAMTKVTVNGKPGRIEDLKESTPVQVMIDDKGKVLSVATIDKDK
jgi:hypothetical protein